jgi:hypothetical protein
MTGSVMYKTKYENVYLFNAAWLTKHKQPQQQTLVFEKSEASHEVPLHDLKIRASYTGNVNNIKKLIFAKNKINSDGYIQSI